MHCSLSGLATATPAGSISQRDAAELAKARCCLTQEQERLLPALYRKTRVERRGSVLLGDDPASATAFFPPASEGIERGPSTEARMDRYARTAPALATDASAQALLQARATAARVTQLVTVTCTGFFAPGVDLALVQGLGLPPTVGRTQVGFMGCHGALNGLRVAAAMVAADPAACVLLCAVELCSLHFHYGWDPEKIVANALFADGAAAAVIMRDSGDPDAWRLASSGSCVFPDSGDAMTWRIGDYGFEMTLSARVPDLIATHLRPWLVRWLCSHGLGVADVGSWAVHPGGPRVVATVAEALALPAGAVATSNRVLAECGNMSSPTILFILDRLRRQAATRPCVALAFGPGLAVEAALWV